MKLFALLGSLTLTFSLLAEDFNPAGTWQGVMIRKGTKMKDAMLVYLEFDKDSDGFVAGYSREEVYNLFLKK